VLAQERARSLRHDSVGSEHLLLALAAADGMAGQILAEGAVTTETIEQALGAVLTPGTHSPPTHLPFRADVRDVLHAAPIAAAELGHDYVGTEHLLLALVTATDPATAPAISTISALGLDADGVRAEIVSRTAVLHRTPQP
jgi:ATP-dependent Clp protease ATP-binding subunit ClpA